MTNESEPMADVTKIAQKLIDAARKVNQGDPNGMVRHKRTAGDVLVAWSSRTRLYNVGTESSSLVYGRRSEVLPLLAKMVANPETSYEPARRAGDWDGEASFHDDSGGGQNCKLHHEKKTGTTPAEAGRG